MTAAWRGSLHLKAFSAPRMYFAKAAGFDLSLRVLSLDRLPLL